MKLCDVHYCYFQRPGLATPGRVSVCRPDGPRISNFPGGRVGSRMKLAPLSNRGEPPMGTTRASAGSHRHTLVLNRPGTKKGHRVEHDDLHIERMTRLELATLTLAR